MLELIAKAAANLKVAHGQLREIERALASMPQAEQPELSYRCEHCIGGQGFKSQERFERHLANVHALGLDELRSPDDAQSAIRENCPYCFPNAPCSRHDDARSATTEPDAA